MFYRSSPPELLLWKDALKICSKFTGEHPCQSVISIKFQSNFIKTTLRHGGSPANLLYIFLRTTSLNLLVFCFFLYSVDGKPGWPKKQRLPFLFWNLEMPTQVSTCFLAWLGWAFIKREFLFYYFKSSVLACLAFSCFKVPYFLRRYL